MARRRRTRMSASATDDLVAGGLVSTEWLAARLDDPRVKVIEGTYHLPTAARDGDAAFLEWLIPGAARLAITEVYDQVASLPPMLPSPDRFPAKVMALLIPTPPPAVVFAYSART